MARRGSRRRSAPEERVGDGPVRDLAENIASLAEDPRAERMTHEQRVAVAYTSAYARLLREQSEEYDEVLTLVPADGVTSETLRARALRCARTVAELNLSAHHEEVDILEHAVPGKDAGAAIVFLDVVKSCQVLIAGDELDRDMLLRRDELDALVNAPPMLDWWTFALRSDGAPPLFGTWRGRRPWSPRKAVRCLAQMPPDPALADSAVQAIAERLDDAVERYRSLLRAHVRGTDRWVPRKAFTLGHELTLLQFGTWGLIDFTVLDEQLMPIPAQAALKLITDSCIVLADPGGDFERYAIPIETVDRRLAAPEMIAWRGAVAALG